MKVPQNESTFVFKIQKDGKKPNRNLTSGQFPCPVVNGINKKNCCDECKVDPEQVVQFVKSQAIGHRVFVQILP